MWAILIQNALLGALLLVVVLLLRQGAPHVRSMRVLLAIITLVAILDATIWNAHARRRSVSVASLLTDLPHLGLPERGYTAASRCQACHPGQHGSWRRSYHRTMTQAATPGAVLGDFRDIELTAHERDYRFERRGGEFWVRMVDPDWERDLIDQGIHPSARPAPQPVWKRVVMTTGSHHHQTTWVGSSRNKQLFNVPFVWLIEAQRWAPRASVFLRPPDHGRDFERWNDNCIECHSTPSGRTLTDAPAFHDTRVAELGISCEACHGPGEEHIRANQSPKRRYALHFGDQPDPTIVNPKRLDARRSAQVCGQCHGMNVFRAAAQAAGVYFKPGDDLLDSRAILRGRMDTVPPDEMDDWHAQQLRIAGKEPSYFSDRFWPDGMVRVSGRDHNAFIESACFQGGELSCLNCHSMHHYADRRSQLSAGMDTNEACLSCHAQYRERLVEHTHHPPGSSGSLCYNCHMPHTVYGLLKNIRSHWIDSPSVGTTLATGRPNACNLCHLDQTLAWTDQYLHRWYGQPPTAGALDADQRAVAASLLWVLKGDANQRALMAWHMGWEPARQASGAAWMPPYLAHLMMDPYSAVRYIAERSLRRIEGFERVPYDFLEPAETLRARRQQVISLWYERQGRAGSGGTQSPAPRRWELLIGPDGQLNAAELARMSAQRDNRPIDLRE